MDTVAAFTAPSLAALDVSSLSAFVGRTRLKIVQAHDDGRPFGFVLKSLLHGRLGSTLRCGRLDLRTLDERCATTRRTMQPWIELAGLQETFPPPPGYYLFRGPELFGFHPAMDPSATDRAAMARSLSRGLRAFLSEPQLRPTGVAALDGRPEVDVLRFFERVVFSATPMRAPSARDRRSRSRRRGHRRDGRPRREQERLQVELDRAFELFGVAPTARLGVVKKVRNRLMLANHPDLLMDQPERVAEATQLAIRINAAYAVIRKARQAGKRA